MKSLLDYIKQYNINESISKNIKEQFDNIYKSYQTLLSNNDIKPVDVDETKLSKGKDSFEKDDLKDESLKQVITNKSFGFVVASQMIGNVNKYFNDGDKELKPTCYPYFYNDGTNEYCVGLLMYDEDVTYIDNFVTLISIEPSLCVTKALTVNKGILNDFCESMKDKYDGIVVKPVHPRLKAIFTQLGFRTFSDNKEFLTLKLK